MKFELKRAVAISLFSLTLGAGVSGCSIIESNTATPSETSSPSASASSEPDYYVPSTEASAPAAPDTDVVADETAASAKVAMDQILEHVKAELPTFRAQVTEDMTEEQIIALIEASFPNTLSYLKVEAFDPADRYEIVNSLSQFYMIDPNTDIESEPSDFKVNGESVTVNVRDFDVWMGGKVEGEEPVPSGNPGVFTLTQENDRWVISGYVSGR